MKVTDIKPFVVDCFRTNWVFVKVYTDEGITGVGEATLEYKEKSLLGALEHIKEYLVGENPLDIEKHFHAIYRDAYWRGGAVLMSALSSVEMALWDILGKSLNVPVYRLLGGKVNEKVRIYVNGWFSGAKEPEEFAQKAKEAVKRGVTAMKWDPFGKSYLNISNKDFDKAMRCVGAVRDAVGNDVDLLIEGHGRFNIPTGIKIAKELEQFKPMFFEEPTPPDNLDALKAVKDKSPVAISAGERLYTRWDYKKMFDIMAADYIQPDISHAGGIMELKKIAAEAESRYIPFAPHNPSGPVANAATLQLAATCPNFEILEIMYSDVDYRKDVTTEDLEYKDGYITIPDRIAYVSSKGGQLGLMRALAIDLGKYNIRVNAVLPGMIKTDRWEKNPEFYEKVPSRYTPIGDVAVGADIADAVWYFAAHARNTTGAELVVDGENTVQLYPVNCPEFN